MMAKQVPDHSNLSPRADDRKAGLQPRGLVGVRSRCLRAPIPLFEVSPRYTALIPLPSKPRSSNPLTSSPFAQAIMSLLDFSEMGNGTNVETGELCQASSHLTLLLTLMVTPGSRKRPRGKLQKRTKEYWDQRSSAAGTKPQQRTRKRQPKRMQSPGYDSRHQLHALISGCCSGTWS